MTLQATAIQREGDASAGRPPRASSTNGWLDALERTSRISTEPRRTLPCVIAEVGELHGARPALIGEHETVTYAVLASRQNRYARWALNDGLGKGDVICLLMGSQPDYLAIWLGLTRVGITVALLNTNLVGPALAHCIEAAQPSRVIVASALLDNVTSALPHLTTRPTVWVHGPGPLPRIDHAIAELSDDFGSLSVEPVTLSDRALLIYTSGTTGLPKAANVSHHRLMMWSHWFAGMMHAGPDDRMYDCLPLYHSIGGVVAVGSVLVAGGAVVLREKFSVSRFWEDVVGNDCTLFQYIGELCRYLSSAPPHALETSHRLRLCAGNGLRGDVWAAFQQRFAIPRILEFYAATEGTVSLYNVEGMVGAVGRVPSFMAHRSPAAIVRHDVAREEPVRDAAGLCQRVAPGEVGELIGRLASDPAQAALRFEGYTSEAASSRKLLRDVFKPGDLWMRTGDLMRQDEQGFFYFVDRIGDTFRWKGENVATTEVAAVLGQAAGVEDVTVYGVAVPGTEGRAGMAALRVGPAFELDGFRNWVAARLPSYARPLFLRFRETLDLTDTFKQKKAALVEDGFDPSRTAEALYVDDAAQGAFRRIDDTVFAAIAAGRLRL